MVGRMLGRRIRHGWLLLALITIAGHADTLEQDAQRFGRLPTIGDARLSPDGTQLLTLIAFEGAYQVGIRDLVTGASKILLSTNGVEFRYQWCEFASASSAARARPTSWLRAAGAPISATASDAPSANTSSPWT
ncbi:MAG: hypothetical protein MK142_14630 [Pseudomonadales bacterium]|nr:hypothetical protein [Pseudomonadales bacterium]